MDFACRLRGFRTLFYRPGAGFVLAGSEKTYQSEQFIGCLHKTVESAFFKPEIFEKNSRFVGREFGDFLFRSRADDERFAAFFLRVIGDFLCERNVVHVLSHVRFGNVSRVNHGFCGEQEKSVHVFLFLFGEFQPSHGHFFFQPVEDFFEYVRFDFILFVARFDHPERFVVTLLNGFDVGENKFEIDYSDISYRVHGVFHVRNVFVLEASHNVNDRVHLSYVRKEFVSESFAFGRALYKPCDIDEFYACRRNFFAVIKRGESGKSFVRNGNHSHVRFDGTERKVRRLRACVRDCVEKSGFADVRQSYDS